MSWLIQAVYYSEDSPDGQCTADVIGMLQKLSATSTGLKAELISWSWGRVACAFSAQSNLTCGGQPLPLTHIHDLSDFPH